MAGHRHGGFTLPRIKRGSLSPRHGMNREPGEDGFYRPRVEREPEKYRGGRRAVPEQRRPTGYTGRRRAEEHAVMPTPEQWQRLAQGETVNGLELRRVPRQRRR